LRGLFVVSRSLTVVSAGLEGQRELQRAHAPVCGVVPDVFEGDASSGVIEGNIDALFFLEISGENGLAE